MKNKKFIKRIMVKKIIIKKFLMHGNLWFVLFYNKVNCIFTKNTKRKNYRLSLLFN